MIFQKFTTQAIVELRKKYKTEWINPHKCKMQMQMQIFAVLITNCQLFSGRYNQIPRNERFCTHCNEGKIGDEFHYPFQCSRFHEQRKKYLKRYYWKNPNTLKMDQLFNCEKKTIFFNLTKFCSYIMTHV